MTTVVLRPTASVTIDTTIVDVEGGTSTLDIAAVPYATSSLVMPLLDDELLDWLDPRDNVRIPYEASDETETPRPFDLGLRSRRVDHAAKTVTLNLASDEALMMDYAALTVDTGARAHESSLRAVCDYVLDKIGASLAPGAWDADVTAYWPLTNYCTNPRAETTAGYTAGANTDLVGIDAGTGGLFGPNYVYWRSAAAGVSDLYTPTVTSVRPGQSYTGSGYFRADVAGRSVRLVMHFYDVDGNLMTQALSPIIAAPAAPGWTRTSVVGVAPPGAVKAQLAVSQIATAGGQASGLDGLMITDGAELVPFFSGATVDSAEYTYEWTGPADASTSTRVPTVERSPDLFTLKPGDNLWDFLVPITAAAGAVLWCDETRAWHLALPEDRVIIATVSVTEATTSDGTDTLSRDDTEASVTGVVVRYKWRDADGVDQEAYDTAGTSEKVLTVDVARPFPGPGMAAAILARRQGTGRRQEVTAVAQITTTPGMTAQISLPGAPDTTGRVAAVTFDHATGFMDLTGAGLVDILPGSIAALLGTIDALVGTIDSL